MKWLHRIGRWIVSLLVVTTVIFFLAAFVFGDILLLFLPPLVWIVAVNFPLAGPFAPAAVGLWARRVQLTLFPQKGYLPVLSAVAITRTRDSAGL
jgi:hypothetical protein